MDLLHQDPSRATIYPTLVPPCEHRGVDFIPVVEPRSIASVLASGDFEVADAAAQYRAIGERTGADFSAVVAALDHIPLVKEGEAHRRLRDEMAAVIAAGAKRAEPRLREDLAAHFKARLVDGATLDLVEDFALPAYVSLFSVLLGVDPAEIREGQVSEVFDRYISLNRRKRLERNMRATLHRLQGSGTLASVPPELALAMTILGRDALVGSLAMALWHEFSRGAGTRLSEFAWPTTLGSTAVPFIERLAVRDTTIGDVPVSAGARVRLYFDATSRETSGADAGLLFGKGRHLCLGKPLAQIAWRVVTRLLAACPLRPLPQRFEFRTGDFLFNFPAVAHVQFRA